MRIDELKDMNDVEDAEYLTWRITIQDAGTGEIRKYIVTCGYSRAFELGRKLETESFGDYILTNVENLTMTDSTFFLHIDK